MAPQYPWDKQQSIPEQPIDPELLKTYAEPSVVSSVNPKDIATEILNKSYIPDERPFIPPKTTITSGGELSVPADKPYGWARRNEKGDLLYITPEGQQRWVEPQQVDLAVKQGMRPLSIVDEFKIKRQKGYEDSKSGIKAALISAADTLSFGGYRYAQRHQGMSYDELMKWEGKGLPSEGKVQETAEEQQARIEGSPISSTIGSVGGLAAGLLTRGPFGVAGKFAGAFTTELGTSIKAVKAASILSEGAAIGLGGAAQQIGMMPEKEYNKIGSGDVAWHLAKGAATGAAINGAFSIIGTGIGFGLNKGKNIIMKRAGVSQEVLDESLRISYLSGADIKNIEESINNISKSAVEVGKPEFVDTINNLYGAVKRSVDNGGWAKVAEKYRDLPILKAELDTAKAELQGIKEEFATGTGQLSLNLGKNSAIYDLEKEIANLERELLTKNKGTISAREAAKKPIFDLIADKRSKINELIQNPIENVNEKLANQASKLESKIKTLEPEVNILSNNKSLNDMLKGKGDTLPEGVTSNFTPISPGSPAEIYAVNVLNNNTVKKLTQKLSSAVPGANIWGRGLASLGLGTIGYVASGGNITDTLVAACLPWAIRGAITTSIKSSAKHLRYLQADQELVKAGVIPEIMTTGEKIAKKGADIGESAWNKILGPAAAKVASENIPILSEDDKQDLVNRAQALKDADVKQPLENGLNQAGMEPDSAKSLADTNNKLADLVLQNKNMNRVDFSKLVAAASNPLGAIGRLAKGKATKQDIMVIKVAYPQGMSAAVQTAKNLYDNLKPSQKNGPDGIILKSVMGTNKKMNLGALMNMQQPATPKMRSGGAGKIGTKQFSGLSTGLQNLSKGIGKIK